MLGNLPSGGAERTVPWASSGTESVDAGKLEQFLYSFIIEGRGGVGQDWVENFVWGCLGRQFESGSQSVLVCWSRVAVSDSGSNWFECSGQNFVFCDLVEIDEVLDSFVKIIFFPHHPDGTIGG